MKFEPQLINLKGVSVKAIGFNRQASMETENPKLQFWTEFEKHPLDTRGTSQFVTSHAMRGSRLRDKDFSANFDSLIGSINCSKLLIFAENHISVVLSKILAQRIDVKYLADQELVTDRVRLEIGSAAAQQWGTPPSRMQARILPNRNRGCSTVRFRTLRPSRGKLAGLPLDNNGIRYSDQNNSKFEDCRCVSIEFYSAESKQNFFRIK
ncbi:MAG: hypothetical protein M1822_002438 [Bathelium mastoideum]|nr:MAG: hypothetical protein M1822_002438 [Bathelium mastoideum]